MASSRVSRLPDSRSFNTDTTSDFPTQGVSADGSQDLKRLKFVRTDWFVERHRHNKNPKK